MYVCLQIESGGVYGEDENRFVFNNVLVGMRAKARFKVTNTNKVRACVRVCVRACVLHTVLLHLLISLYLLI